MDPTRICGGEVVRSTTWRCSHADYWIISQFKLCVVSSLTQELSSCESALNVRANKEKNSGFWKCLRGWKTASASNDSSWKLENSSNVFAYGVSYMFICSSAYIWSCVFCNMITMSYLARLLLCAGQCQISDGHGSPNGDLDPQTRELFLPFRCFCTRKDVGFKLQYRYFIKP